MNPEAESATTKKGTYEQAETAIKTNNEPRQNPCQQRNNAIKQAETIKLKTNNEPRGRIHNNRREML
jgi:hypothetical protein